MTDFDDILERFLLDPESGVLPGLGDPSIDNVAWHDFAQYEFLQEPMFYDPPDVAQGGTWPPGGRVLVLPGDCDDWPCPGGTGGLCPMEDVLYHLDDPTILLPPLQQFLETVSRAVTSVIARKIGLPRGAQPPEFALQVKSAYEAAIIQGGSLSKLYRAYVSIPPGVDRDSAFLAATAWPPDDWCTVIHVWPDWKDGDPIPTSVFRDVDIMVDMITSASQRVRGGGVGASDGQIASELGGRP